MDTFDAIVVGAGPAGLSLAEALLDGPLVGRRLLMVDAPSSGADAHALAWWSDRPYRWDDLVRATWDRVAVSGPGQRTAVPLGAYRYRVLDGATLHETLGARLRARPELTWVDGVVDGVEDGPDHVVVRAGERAWSGRWVFDSRCHLAELAIPDDRVSLVQGFVGWHVRATRPVFDPNLPVIMDLSFPQDTHLRFLYLLPWSTTEALVEAVSMGPDVDVPDARAWALDRLGEDTEVERVEGGVTALTDMPFVRRVGRRVLRIGVAGGRLKPSTGYALTRILDDTDAIVASLARVGHPFDLPRSPRRWAYLDAVMLRVLARRPAVVARAFLSLFGRQPGDRVLRFLDERASVWDVVAVGMSLPLVPFVVAGVAEAWRRLVRLLRAPPSDGMAG